MHQWKLYAGILILSAPAWAIGPLSEDEQIMKYLAKLDFAVLQEVEISLDDTFDVFDGLVKKHHTEVATGVKQSTQRAPAVTSVITAQDIEVMGARTLEEALQSVPGFQVSYNWYNTPVYSIRGVSSSFNPEVLVLVNGFRINNIYSGGKHEFWTSFPVSTIARIEVIRGPGSAIYGADAFAGVVNIITKTARDIDGTEIGVRLGNFNTRDVWALHSTQWKGFEIAAMAEFTDSDGHQRTVESDAQTVFDQMFGTNVSLAPGPYGSKQTNYDIKLDIAKKNWQFRAGWFKNDHTEAGTGVAQALDPTKPRELRRITGDLTYNNPTFTDNWAIETQLNYMHTESILTWQLFPPGAFGGTFPIGYLGYPSGSETHTQLSVSGTYRGFNHHLIRIGAGYGYYDMYEVGDLRNFGINPLTNEPLSPLKITDISDTWAAYVREAARENQFGFIQDSWTLAPQWELTTGIRYDYYSDFGSTTNPRLGLVWEPRTNLVVKLLYGHAFRAPSFQDLYNQNNPVAIGNPNLGPEKIETWELAFDYRATNKLHLTLNLFQYEIKDKIITTPIGPTEQGFANVASWKGQGGELELRWKTSNKSSVLFNYSYQDSEDKMTGATLHNASQQTTYLRGDYLFGSKWYINTQMNWHNGWKRAANDPRSDLEGYTTVDLILRRKDIRVGNTNFAIGIRNVFNTDIRYPSPGPDTNGILNIPNDLPGAGRFYFAEFRYKF